MGGALRSLRRMEHRGRRSRNRGGAKGPFQRVGQGFGGRNVVCQTTGFGPHPYRHQRIRSGLWLWPGSGLGVVGGGGTRHWQIHLAAAGGGQYGKQRHQLPVYQRRRSGGANPQPRPPAGDRRRSGASDRRQQRPRYFGDRAPGRPGGGRRDRFHPDHVRGQFGIGAGVRGPGPGQRPGPDRPGQARWLLPGDAGPCDEGRHHRRPPGVGAHGRHGVEFRGRPQPPIPHPARRQKPPWRQ